MSPDRLNSDQQLLYGVLKEVWDKNNKTIRDSWEKNTNIIIAACAIFASLVVGVMGGVLYGSRQSLRQTSVVIRELEERTRLDRELLLHTSKEQQRASAERAAIVHVVGGLRRDLEKFQHIEIKNKDGKNK